MSIFPAPEQYGQFDLVPIVEKFRCPAPFRLKVVIVNLGPNADFLEFDDVLMLPGFALLAALLVSKFSVIHQPTDRRNRVWSNLYQIKSALPCHFERVSGLNDANLGSQFVDQTNFTDPNTFVDPCLNWPCDGLPPRPQ